MANCSRCPPTGRIHTEPTESQHWGVECALTIYPPFPFLLCILIIDWKPIIKTSRSWLSVSKLPSFKIFCPKQPESGNFPKVIPRSVNKFYKSTDPKRASPGCCMSLWDTERKGEIVGGETVRWLAKVWFLFSHSSFFKGFGFRLRVCWSMEVKPAAATLGFICLWGQ